MNLMARSIGFAAGWILIFLGGVTVGTTTVVGVALVYWSITSQEFIGGK